MGIRVRAARQTGASAKLTAAVQARKGADFDVQTMTLGVDPATAKPRWTVTGERARRLLAFSARSDAAGLERVN